MDTFKHNHFDGGHPLALCRQEVTLCGGMVTALQRWGPPDDIASATSAVAARRVAEVDPMLALRHQQE
ncbi:MAG TPA: hypothetical protein VK706_05300 [Candidatus Sulfotelmatobacter sp.]|jgi:hypothetical protein|nr:hypothetical protein [Candidatus Sulfotelmatobacter sp.]